MSRYVADIAGKERALALNERCLKPFGGVLVLTENYNPRNHTNRYELRLVSFRGISWIAFF